jgi:SAM-dependent methyltransferase
VASRAQAVKRRIPATIRPIARDLYHRIYRAGLKIQWWLLDQRQSRSADPKLPLPRSRLRFRVGEDSSVLKFFTVGRQTAESLKETFQMVGFELTACKTILDIGCGCGRTLMWLMREFQSVRWYGTDVDWETIDWCRRFLPHGTFQVNDPLPPLSAVAGSFDCVYGVSLFTHLSQPSQELWLKELHRILRPGGLLILTLHSRHVWQWSEYATTVERDGLLFCGSQKLKGILPDWYQTTFQTRSHIVNSLTAHFEGVEYFERRFGNQDAVVARRSKSP